MGFFAFLIGNFNSLCKVVYQSFSGLGLEAAGSTLSAQTLLQPGRLAQVGIDAGKPILAAAGNLMGYVSFFTNGIQIFVLLVAWVVVVLSFFVLAIQLFVVLIEFKLTTLAGFVLIPFALFNKTAFLAKKVLGNVVASGVKILVLAVIVGIGSTLFSQFTLVAGAPQLGAGAAVGTALTAGGLGAAAALGAGAAIGAAGSGLGAAARGASRLSASSAAPATAAASNATSPSPPPAWAQRLQRGARHAGRAALHVVRSEGHGGANSVSLDQEERR